MGGRNLQTPQLQYTGSNSGQSQTCSTGNAPVPKPSIWTGSEERVGWSNQKSVRWWLPDWSKGDDSNYSIPHLPSQYTRAQSKSAHAHHGWGFLWLKNYWRSQQPLYTTYLVNVKITPTNAVSFKGIWMTWQVSARMYSFKKGKQLFPYYLYIKKGLWSELKVLRIQRGRKGLK